MQCDVMTSDETDNDAFRVAETIFCNRPRSEDMSLDFQCIRSHSSEKLDGLTARIPFASRRIRFINDISIISYFSRFVQKVSDLRQRHLSSSGSAKRMASFSGLLSNSGERDSPAKPTSRSYVHPAVPHRHPRQREVWEMQSAHQSRLNYLHFIARLDDSAAVPAHQPVEDADLLAEERQLAETLTRERLLLEEARAGVASEIDRIQRMLKEFRRQRKMRLAEKQRDNKAKGRMYDEELQRLRMAIEDRKSDISVSIHRVDWEDSSSLTGRQSDETRKSSRSTE
jgi:hypothetical protein